MKIKSFSYSNVSFIMLCVMMYLMMYGVMLRYFNNPYLWFDEAGQFWIAKGLNHDSDPFSACGGLYDVIVNNSNYNLDPGGFSILLHYWAMISSHHLWLRILPFGFFILTNIGFVILSYSWSKNKNIAMMIGMMPFLVPMIFNEAFELRAYSMEVLGCVVCVLAMDYLQKQLSIKSLFLWSLLISIFLTSRYSFIIVAFFTSLYVLYLIYQQNVSISRKLIMAIVYAAPMLLFLCYDYFFALRYQNPQLETLSYLPYINSTPNVILSKSSLLLLLSLLVIIYLSYVYWKTELLSKYCGLVFVTLGTNSLFFIFSVLGMHPWEGSCTRCISMVTLVVLCLCAIVTEVYMCISKTRDIRYIAISCAAILLLSTGYELHNAYQVRSNSYTELMSVAPMPSRIYVDRLESPCMRYLFEYGKLRNDTRFDYPKSFTFAKSHPHALVGNNQSLKDWYKDSKMDWEELHEDYDILIAPELYRYKPSKSEMWESVNDNKRVWVKKNNKATIE